MGAPRRTGRRGAHRSGVRLRGDGVAVGGDEFVLAAVVVEEAALGLQALELPQEPRAAPLEPGGPQGAEELRCAEPAVALVGPEVQLCEIGRASCRERVSI